MRLLVGVFLRGTGGSLLAAGVVHGVYNACNNNGALLDHLLQDADQNLAAPIALLAGLQPPPFTSSGARPVDRPTTCMEEIDEHCIRQNNTYGRRQAQLTKGCK